MKIILNKLPAICLILIGLTIGAIGQVSPADRAVLANFNQAIENGKLQETERPLFNYVVAHSADGEGFAVLAKLRLKQKRFTEAKSLAAKALTLAPNLAMAKLILAQSAYQLSDAAALRDALNQLTEQDFSDSLIRFGAAQLYAETGDCAVALRLADKLPLKTKNAAALPLRAKCYLQTGDKKSLASLLLLAKNQAGSDPRVVTDFAAILFKNLMLRETAELMRAVVSAAPGEQPALLLLAKAEIFLKDFLNARNHLAQAEKIQPDSAELYFVSSLLASEQGNIKSAYELLEKSLSLDSNNPQTLGQFVVVAVRVGQAARAWRAAEKLLALEPENPEHLYLYGLSALQTNNLPKAEEALTKYFELRPKDSRGCLALGLTYAASSEQLAAARRQLQKCLQIDSTNIEAAYQLGLSYKTAGEFAKAIEYLQQTVKLAPNYAPALRDLGAVYLQTGAEVRARPLLEKAALLSPDNADSHFQLSRLYNLLGETELAKKHLKEFQRLKAAKEGGM